jgi:uncharacterized protein DUF6885
VAEAVTTRRGRIAALQQKDNLCGPFHAARLLREAGFEELDGELLDQDLIALRAGTLLPDVEDGPQVPPGADSLRDYRFELPRVAPAESGTSAAGLAGAIEAASGGELRCVPLRCAAWDGDAVERLVEAAPGVEARLLANVSTARLWGSRPPFEALLATLDGEPVDPPAPDWSVGHFVELSRLVRGGIGSLVLVVDSYPTLGWLGRHLQPPAAVAAALGRGDGREGGVLGVAARERAGALEELARGIGLEIGFWDNGTTRR